MQSMRAADRNPEEKPTIVFGPIPSRRLGRSLGINNIPPKVCSYGCVYCQVGATTSRETAPRAMYPLDLVVREVTHHVERLRLRDERIDYLTFAPDGEPTLDANLEMEIDALRPLGIPIAVFTNASLTPRPEVRRALRKADWVSVKVDSVDESIWREVDRPDPDLDLTAILEGIRELAIDFPGTLVGETMLVAGINDSEESVLGVAQFFRSIRIERVYLLVPTRPPTFSWVEPPDESVVVRTHQILSDHVAGVECIVGREPDDFAATGDARTDLLRIASVHPIRTSAVRALLAKEGASWDIVEDLVDAGELRRVDYRGTAFYLRPIGTRGNRVTTGGGRGER